MSELTLIKAVRESYVEDLQRDENVFPGGQDIRNGRSARRPCSGRPSGRPSPATARLSLTVDHRVLDGEPLGRFTRVLHDLLTHPELLAA